jgi:two-component sensor histidine kinase
VVAPTRKGFGSKLIRLGLVGTGGTELRYEPGGFEADLRASIDHLSQA